MVRDSPACGSSMLSTRPVRAFARSGRYGMTLLGLGPLVLCMMITLLRPQPALGGRRR
jgi:hypothetical protein